MFNMGFPSDWSTLRKLIWLRAALLRAASAVIRLVTGTAPLILTNAVHRAIHSLTQYGLCTQASTPAPDAPVDILCNNGAVRLGHNEHDAHFVQYLNAYIKSSNRQITAYNGNSVVTYDCEVGKSYHCYDVGASGNALSVNVGYSDTVPEIGTTYSANDFESIPCPDGYRVGGLIFTAKKRFVTFIFRYDGDSSKTPESMLSQMVFTEVGKEVGTLYTDGTPEVLTVALNYASGGLDGYGTYVSPTTTAGNRAYKRLEVPNGAYQFSVDGDYEIIVQWRDPANPSFAAQRYENLTGWITSGTVTLDKPSGGYGVTVRRTSGTSITPSNFDGTLYCFKTSDIQTVTDVPMLLSVNDYKDEAEIISGGVTHRVGIKVFDGTEEWIDGSNGYITEAVQDQRGETYAPVCSHFRGVNTVPVKNSNTVRVYRTSGGTGRVYFAPNMTTYPTKEDFAAWLAAQYAAGTPVIVLYPLATETTEQGTPHALRTVEGTNEVDVAANVSPVTLEVEYYATPAAGFGLGSPGGSESEPGEDPEES